jgi:very-short-patch-repair endonuclease
MPDAVVRLFVRHQWQRDQGTPRVSVLVGETRRGRQLWARWLELAGREADTMPVDLDAALARANTTPALPIAFAITARAYDAWKAKAADRARALAREGVVAIDGIAAPPRAKASAPVGIGTIDSARSLAEVTLFEALEATRWSAGKFRLNQRLPFRFGGTDVECDLLARDERVAIEIDGYHHFVDADAYRRDGHKDLLLQAHGFAVLRFLAEDVARDPKPALNHISEYLGHKLRREGAR